MKFFELRFLLIMFIGAVTFLAINRGYYPAAIVNGSMIWARDVNTAAKSAYNFYLQANEAGDGPVLTGADARALLAEVRRASLEKFIEEKLIEKELRDRFDDGARELIDKKMKIADNQTLRDAVYGLYGVSLEEFRDLILRKEAVREVLSEDFKAKNQDFPKWLEEAKKSASVSILSGGYSWNNGGL